MKVRLLEGKRAGEIADMPFRFAQPLIAAGRVVVLVDETETPVTVAAPESRAAAPVGKSKKGT